MKTMEALQILQCKITNKSIAEIAVFPRGKISSMDKLNPLSSNYLH